MYNTVMRILFVGGGTGGHFYPLIATAEALTERVQASGSSAEFYYMGPNPYNQNELDRVNMQFVYCPAGKQRLYFSILNFTDKFKIVGGIFVAFYKLLWLYPDVVMSKGGYTSTPVVIAAWLLRIPIVIHESDAVPGRANKLAAKLARYIAIAHDEVASYFPTEKVALIGMPIRKSFFNPTKDPQSLLGVPNDRPIIFITGGSSGAERLNDLVLNSLDELLPDYTVIHQTGESHQEKVTATAKALISDSTLLNRYFILGTLTEEQFPAALDAASIVVSRAGSGTIFEIALKGKPSILIPIPEKISRDQRKNAYSYARTGASLVIEERNLTDHILAAEVKHILESPELREKMTRGASTFTNRDAAYKLADTLIGIGQEHE